MTVEGFCFCYLTTWVKAYKISRFSPNKIPLVLVGEEENMKNSGFNRRRRRATPQEPNEHQNSPTTIDHGDKSNESNYYYDDGSDDDKGHRRDEDRIFKASCSFGQFVLNPCLCLFKTTMTCTKRSGFRLKNFAGASSGIDRKTATFIFPVLLILVTITIFATSGTKFPALRRLLLYSSSTTLARPLTDEILNRIPVKIPMLEFEGKDIGGWKNYRRFSHPTGSLDTSKSSPSFGGLETIVVENLKADADSDINNKNPSNKLLSPRRLINPDDEKLALKDWKKLTKHDPKVHSYDMNREDLEDSGESCRPPTFAKQYYPQCNAVHELSLVEDFDKERAMRPGDDQAIDSFYISHGAFRDVWVVYQPYPKGIKTALKTSRYKHSFNPRTYWYILNDALVMERLTGSPRIVDIYTHCGTTVLVEAMPHEVEEVIIKGDGMAKQEDLHDEDGVKPLNDYTIEEKLDMALLMAESIADLHGFRDGVIVHDDVQLCQWLKRKDGTMKLGDFNRAEVMEYDTKEEKYCKYYNGGCGGNYRAPEEYDKDYLNEQIDVFSFGNNIYGLLTGLWVFYDVDDDETVQERVINGTRAFIDPRWRERSYIESKLVELMEKCWIQDTEKRIDIFEAVRQLREIKKEHESRKTRNKVGSK